MGKERIMNIKLRILSIWIPKFILIRELERTSYIINDHLDKLLDKYSISHLSTITPLNGNLEECRSVMGEGHAQRVHALVKTLGFDKACEVGRAEMFKAGYEMGCEATKRLGVGKNINDSIVAARILYNVLGINFIVEKHGKNIFLRIKSCALAKHYSLETCKIMSAVDEGVITGLNNNLGMKFLKMITEGAEECTACITVKVDKK